jgi:hypothetical protein
MEFPLRRPLKHRLNPVERYGVRLSLFAFAVLLVGVPFGLLVEQVITDGPVTEMDNVAADRLHAWLAARPTLKYITLAVTILGNIEWLYAFAAAACVLLWMRGAKRLIVYVAVTTVVGGIINITTKIIIARPRPLFEDPLASAFGKSSRSGGGKKSRRLMARHSPLTLCDPRTHLASRVTSFRRPDAKGSP